MTVHDRPIEGGGHLLAVTGIKLFAVNGIKLSK